jgi:hypothetical protein
MATNLLVHLNVDGSEHVGNTVSTGAKGGFGLGVRMTWLKLRASFKVRY